MYTLAMTWNDLIFAANFTGAPHVTHTAALPASTGRRTALLVNWLLVAIFFISA